jgi:nicotinamidase-related amidase
VSKALIVIDIQNDYFPDGNYPLWNTEVVLERTELAIEAAKAKNIPIVLVQHVAASPTSPFLRAQTQGVEIHPRIRSAAPDAPVVVKTFADSFEKTEFQTTLDKLGVDELLLCGMMTQNCITHTAISKSADGYKVSILGDCCTTVDEMVHEIALGGVAPRVPVITAEQALA